MVLLGGFAAFYLNGKAPLQPLTLVQCNVVRAVTRFTEPGTRFQPSALDPRAVVCPDSEDVLVLRLQQPVSFWCLEMASYRFKSFSTG